MFEDDVDAYLAELETMLAAYGMCLGAALLTKLRREPSALQNALLATRAMLAPED